MTDPIRAALAAPTPESDINTVLRLAAIIRKVDGSHSLGAAALAEAIPSHSAAREVFSGPPPADGEVEDLARCLGSVACHLSGMGWVDDADYVDRAAALLRQLPPEGLMPVEYFHTDSGARIFHEPCDGEPGWCWTVSNSHVNPCTEFPTLAAAWEALQQARRQEVGND